MSILKRVKSVLGLNGSSRAHQEEPVPVTVQEERSIESEPDDSATADEAVEDEPDQVEEDTARAQSAEPVTVISGIGPAYAEKLGDAGIETVADLQEADAVSVAEQSGLSEGRVSSWIEAAQNQ